MTWKTEQPKPQSVSSTWATDDGILLSVTFSRDTAEWWQYFALSFGVHTHMSHETCLENWPAEAIRLARKKLDRLERALDGEGLQ